jgi:uncharacterized repeat protein (TIGR01451 family)
VHQGDSETTVKNFNWFAQKWKITAENAACLAAKAIAFQVMAAMFVLVLWSNGAQATDTSRSSVGATAETGEPGPYTPINSMWYTWTAASAGTLVIQTCSAAGTTFDTTLTAYTGTAVGALTQLQQNDDTPGCATSVNAGYGSRLTLQVSQGTTYQIQMDGYAGAMGTFLLQYTFTPASITVTITDASATEGADTAAFTVSLATQPSANTTVTVAADASGQCTFTPTTLTFTTANYATAQTVTATAVNDVVPEGVHSCATGAITASGSNYSTVTGAAPSFTVNDNDQGIIIANTVPTATEGGATGAFTAKLSTLPTGNVTVSIAADSTGQCTFTPVVLTFTTANWNIPQTVTTTAVNDAVVEGTHSCSTGVISAAGGGYAGVTGTAPAFTITDNDTGTLVVTNTVPTAAEGGATGAFTAALGLQPSGTVTVTIAADGSGQCTFASATLTFTTANWNTAQTVSATAVNDLIVEGTHSCATGAISASGGSYTGVTGTAPTFTITDNDAGSLVLLNTTPTAAEGGAAGAFTIKLGLQPSGTVTIAIAIDASGQCTFAPATLTFTTVNWNTVQNVAATAVNDTLVEGTHSCSTGAISASGGGYTGVNGTAPTFTITDNDTGSITVVNTVSTAAEGGANGAFTVVLTAQPGSNVTVAIAPDPAAPAQCTFAPTPLTFTSANWNTAQTVSTAAINDTLVEGAHSCTTGVIGASGSGYSGVTGTSPTFTITDNDTGAIALVKTVGSATEGGATGAFTVVLTAQPGSNVTVAIGIDAAGQCTFAPTPLTFTNANWNVAQAVTATAVNDLLVEGAHFCTTGSIAASGSGYTGVTETPQTFAITDNDTASIILTKNASVASVAIAGNVISYTIQISNTGSGVASAITVSDTLVAVTCPTSGTNTIASLAPSSSETCTGAYTAKQVDFDSNGGGDGDIDNSASANGTSGGVPVSASGSKAVLCTQNSSLTLVKTANQTGPLTVGQVVAYTFLSTNTGNVTLSNVAISETAFNGSTPPLGTPLGETLTDNAPLNTLIEKSEDTIANNGVWTTLKPNDAVTFSINYTVTQNDIDLLQ